MPGATASGYPYPVGTDRVMDGDDAIHTLADKIEANLKQGMVGGTVSVALSAAVDSGGVSVTFPAGRFTVAPTVVAGSQASASGVWATHGVTSATSTIVFIHARSSATGTFGVTYLAFGG